MRPVATLFVLLVCALDAAAQVVATGTYTGNGTDGRSINVGFQPGVVIIKVDYEDPGDSDLSSAVIRTSTMTGDNAKPMKGSQALLANQIESLDASGFTVGDDLRVNAAAAACGGANCTYYWVALQATQNFSLGSYTGDGVSVGDAQPITGLGFTPEYVIVLPDASIKARHRTHHGTVESRRLSANGSVILDAITSMDTNGFTVEESADTQDSPNTNGVVYHYLAVRSSPGHIAIGEYLGDDTDNRQITGLGLTPEYIIISGYDGSRDPYQKTADMAGDASVNFRQVVGANRIQALLADGFEIGDNTTVNDLNINHFYLAFDDIQVNYRSIGTRVNYGTSEPEGGGTTVTATTGSRTVTGAGTQWITSNRGRGDVIQIDGSDYQILKVDTQNQITLRGPFAGVTASGKSYTIARQFQLLQVWDDCVAGLGFQCTYFPTATNSLVNDDRAEVGIAYNDSPFTAGLQIEGANVDASHTITLTVDPGNRHSGVAGTGVVLNNGSSTAPAIEIRDGFTTVEWFEVTGGSGTAAHGIKVEGIFVGDDVVVRNNLIHNGPGPGVFLNASIADTEIYNNIVYETAVGIDVGNLNGSGSLKIMNNTVFSSNGPNGGNSTGIYAPITTGSILVQNNIAHSNSIGDFSVATLVASSSNNLSGDGSALSHSPGGGDVSSQPLGNVRFLFTTPGIENLHIASGSTAENAAADLSATFTLDIDGDTRQTVWEIGADDITSVANYRSIGTAADHSAGTINTTAGSTTVTGTGAGWVAANRGRGDRIDINGTDYTILAVVSDNELRLTSPATTTFGGAYTISRKFTTLQAWEDCIDGPPGTACPYFPVASNDFVADNRSEVGIAYADSEFDLTTDVEIDDSVTDATHTITLTADGTNRHYGTAMAGVTIDGQGNSVEVLVRDSNVTIEWLDLGRFRGTDNKAAIRVVASPGDIPTNVLLQNLLIHTFLDLANDVSGIRLSGDAGKSVTVRNTMIWAGDEQGIEGDEAADSLVIENCSIDQIGDTGARGIAAGFTTVTVRNTIVTRSGTDFAPGGGGFSPSSFNNISSDATAPGSSALTGVTAATVFAGPGSDLHLRSGANPALDTGADLFVASGFRNDIDGELRPAGAGWDRGADERDATTEVALVSFAARGSDSAVHLEWETATELYNVGFHLYRATSAEGPFERITAKVVPGLGSSPAGARYRYVDDGLTNGVTYTYELEDIETTGRTTRHGPVSATPLAGVTNTESSSAPRMSYGEPEANELRIVKRTDRVVVLELVTRGFYAEPLEDGTVEVTVPSYLESEEASVPVKRFWLDLPFDREVKRVRVVEREVERFSGLTPAGLSAKLVAERDGTVRAARRRRRARGNLLPEQAARVVSQGFQGSEHKALLELAPLRFSEELVLTRRLVVRVVLGKRKLPRARVRGRASVRLVTREPGLYAVRYRGQKVRLSRQGETVPYHREGKTLYFLGEQDAVYELSREPGQAMIVVDGTPSGPVLPYYWHTEGREENRFYQAALVSAPDVWLWDYLIAPMEKDFSFEVSGLASSERAKIRVWLQGTSERSHHVKFLVNGNFVGETGWDGQNDHVFEAETLVLEGTNTLTLESAGTTSSMMMLDRFEVVYPRQSAGELEGVWDAGTADVSGLDEAYVLDVSEDNPRWVEADGARFSTEAGNRYLVAAQPKTPEIVRVRRSNLLKKTRRAQWILIGPEAFLAEAEPLVNQRQDLRARAVSVESIYDEFGYGEESPEAIRDFLTAVYQETGSLQYVVLLGDATFDSEDYLGTGVKNQVPPMMVKTSYLWTASDPAYAAVNGDDLLPDIAIGRLPAASVVEARTLVRKILAYERSGMSLLDGQVVLVADDPDRAGDFVADAEALASGHLSDKTMTKLYLPDATRQDVIQAFDDGASLMSYLGHGAIHLWADENIFNNFDVASLSSQPHQPLLLTMNCLNGYFHFPYFDSLAESLLKAEGKGVIAAFSPSGLSLNEPATRYQEALVDELLRGGHQRLGDAVLEAQKRYAETGAFPELLTIYHLFGDPALPLR